jgi:sulfur-carrier protein adenylyltransferase/sulfurtransferase
MSGDETGRTTVVASGESQEIPTIEPSELEHRLRAGDALDLVDVRDPNEWELGHLEGARLAPQSTFPAALASFDEAREVVLYCKGGLRSTRIARLLLAAGFQRVSILAGGIVRWAEEIDPTVAHG